jgi:hypothetical protein
MAERYNREKLIEGIRNAVQRILEERRIDEADKANNPIEHEADRLYDKIYALCLRTVPDTLRSNVQFWEGAFMEVLFGANVNVHYKVVSYPTEEDRKKVYNVQSLQKKLGFNTKTFDLFLSYEIVDGVTDENVVADDFGHELNHVYQEVCRMHNQHEQKVYDKDLYGAVGERMNSKNSSERCIAKLMYYSNRREQDSMIQGLKCELRKRNVELDKVDDVDIEFNKNAEEYERWIRYFLKHSDSPDMKKTISFYNKNFGYDYRGIYDLIRFRYSRLMRKYERAMDEYSEWYRRRNGFFSERRPLDERYIF